MSILVSMKKEINNDEIYYLKEFDDAFVLSFMIIIWKYKSICQKVTKFLLSLTHSP